MKMEARLWAWGRYSRLGRRRWRPGEALARREATLQTLNRLQVSWDFKLTLDRVYIDRWERRKGPWVAGVLHITQAQGYRVGRDKAPYVSERSMRVQRKLLMRDTEWVARAEYYRWADAKPGAHWASWLVCGCLTGYRIVMRGVK